MPSPATSITRRCASYPLSANSRIARSIPALMLVRPQKERGALSKASVNCRAEAASRTTRQSSTVFTSYDPANST